MNRTFQIAAAFTLFTTNSIMALPMQKDIVLHLDASHLKAGALSVWSDASGRGNDVTQSDTALQPLVKLRALAGKPSVIFSGNQYLDGRAALPEGAKSLTIAAVWKRNETGGSQVIIEQAAPGIGRRACFLTTDEAYGFNGEFNDQHAIMPYKPGKFVVSVLRLNNDGVVSVTQNSMARSAAIDMSKQNIGAVKIRIGGKIYGVDELLKGSIAEIIVYDHALSDIHVQELSRELGRKWGIKMDSKDPAIAEYENMIRENAANPARYTEVYRPQYHFMPIGGWMNDPNGLCYFQGHWHMFYQTLYKNTQQSWGHAISSDLVHWTHLPPAITPDVKGAIWSGSAVIDWQDTSGFFGGKPGMVCIFTYFDPAEGGRQSQGMAYSPDGIHFTKYDKNPIIPQLRYQPGQPDEADFRDPKVFWYEPTKRWIMITGGGTIRFYSSPNLRDWTFESINKGINSECPDFFKLPVDGDKNHEEWVLNGAGDWYMLGDFNGKVFTPQSDRIKMNYGNDFYASQTWSDVPGGRRIMTAWMYKWGYSGDVPFPISEGGGMTLPVELTLKNTPEGIRLYQNPVKELQTLRGKPFTINDRLFSPEDVPNVGIKGKCLEISAEFENLDSKEFGLRVRKDSGGDETVVGYNAEKQNVFIDRRRSGYSSISDFANIYEAPLLPEKGRIKLHIFVDWASVELFANDGEKAQTCLILPPPTADGIQLFSKGGRVRLVSLKIYPLKSIWRSTAEDSGTEAERILMEPKKQISMGQESILGALVWPESARPKDIKWQVSDPTILTIKPFDDEHMSLHGIKPGNAEISATEDKVKSVCSVTVLNPDTNSK
jgi:fructan beta-fructosidase